MAHTDKDEPYRVQVRYGRDPRDFPVWPTNARKHKRYYKRLGNKRMRSGVTKLMNVNTVETIAYYW